MCIFVVIWTYLVVYKYLANNGAIYGNMVDTKCRTGRQQFLDIYGVHVVVGKTIGRIWQDMNSAILNMALR